MSDDNHTILIARVATLEAKLEDLLSKFLVIPDYMKIMTRDIRVHDEMIKDLANDLMALGDELNEDEE